MKLDCKHVWGYISDYIDDSVEAGVLEHCEICSAILDSTRNILILTADKRTFEVPVGFSEKLHRRLEEEIKQERKPDEN